MERDQTVTSNTKSHTQKNKVKTLNHNNNNNHFDDGDSRTASHSIRSTPLSTWLRLVVGVVGLWPLFGCWALADASNHQELDPPPAQRLDASSTKQHLPFTIMLNLIHEQQQQQQWDGREHHDLSPEQIHVIEQIFLAGLNASDHLLNVLEPRLYKEG